MNSALKALRTEPSAVATAEEEIRPISRPQLLESPPNITGDNQASEIVNNSTPRPTSIVGHPRSFPTPRASSNSDELIDEIEAAMEEAELDANAPVVRQDGRTYVWASTTQANASTPNHPTVPLRQNAFSASEHSRPKSMSEEAADIYSTDEDDTIALPARGVSPFVETLPPQSQTPRNTATSGVNATDVVTNVPTESAAVAPTESTSRRVYLPDGVATVAEAKEISAFISGILKQPLPHVQYVTGATPPATFFQYGTDSITGVSSAITDDIDTIPWSVPGSAFKFKVDLPRLGDLTDISSWRNSLDHAQDVILTLLRALPAIDHPFRGLNPTEMRLSLLDVFDCHMLLKAQAKKQLSTRFFGGKNLRAVPNATIYQALIKHSQDQHRSSTQATVQAALEQLQMRSLTIEDFSRGTSLSEAFAVLFDSFSEVIERHHFTGHDGTTQLTHALMQLIEPQVLRKYMVKYLADGIATNATVTTFEGSRQRVTLMNVWTVFQFIHKHLKDHFDARLLESPGYLDTLLHNHPRNYTAGEIPAEFVSMQNAPYRRRNTPGTNTTPPDRKRPNNSGDSNPRASKKPKWQGRQRSGTGSGTGKPDTSKSAKPDSSKPAKPDSSKSNDNRATPPNPPPAIKGVDRSTPPACCLCQGTGHKAKKCPVYKTCTCGQPLAKNHDPFRCKQGPLTDEGKKKLGSLKRS
jgi:hypothetical protein